MKCAVPTLSRTPITGRNDCKQPLRQRFRCMGAAEKLDAESVVLNSIRGVKGRGQKGLSDEEMRNFDAAVRELEAVKGVEGPTKAKELLGRWKLLYTSTPGTESPIQRTFTGIDAFQVFQDVVQDEKTLRIQNVVRFGQVGALRVEAEANTDDQPMPGFVPRKSPGLPVFGKSSTEPPDSKDKRIDFWFDQAAFKLGFLPFKIPYPVPFRLLGDETKGWLDITYMDPQGRFRLSRGNKGTLFVLTKEDRSKKQELLDAITEGGRDKEVLSLIEEMRLSNPTSQPARSEVNNGKWRVVWSQQGRDANILQKSFSDVNQWQVLSATGLETIAILVPGLVKLRLQADIRAESDVRSEVTVSSLQLEIPGKKFPIQVDDRQGYFDWWYLDESLRISYGSKDSTFIHLREDS